MRRLVPRQLQEPLSVLARTFHLFFDDQCGTYAAAIAYYAIFSLVPLALVTLSIFGLVVDRERIVRFVFDEVPLKETASVRANVENIIQRAQQVSPAGITFGLIALLWSGSGIFSAVRRGLQAAGHRGAQRPYWHSKLMDVTLVPALGLLIMLSVVFVGLTQLVIEKADTAGGFDTNLALRVTSFVVPAVVSFVTFYLLYRYVPTSPPASREAIAGALFATVLFELAKDLYAAFIQLTPYTQDTAIYAGFGTALIFLFWMFINASVLLLGAEFSRALEERRPAAQPGRAPVPVPPGVVRRADPR